MKIAPFVCCGLMLASACASSTSPCAPTAPADSGGAEVAAAPTAPPAGPHEVEVPMPEGRQQVAVRAAATPWTACPANLPEPCRMAVLEGDPKAATLFTVRFSVPAGFELPPHVHSKPERVTIVSGTVGVGFGDTMDKTRGERFTAGDHYINAPGVDHYVWTEEPSVIQIHGIGPWTATPVNASKAE